MKGPAFIWTALILVLAPIVADANILGSYVPFILLRLWLVGFSLYGILLARRAGGFRRGWVAVYALIGATFTLVWGLEVEMWAVLDWLAAGLVLLSTAFLRTEPLPPEERRRDQLLSAFTAINSLAKPLEALHGLRTTTGAWACSACQTLGRYTVEPRLAKSDPIEMARDLRVVAQQASGIARDPSVSAELRAVASEVEALAYESLNSPPT